MSPVSDRGGRAGVDARALLTIRDGLRSLLVDLDAALADGVSARQPGGPTQLVLSALDLAGTPLKGTELRSLVRERDRVAIGAEAFGPILQRARDAAGRGPLRAPVVVRALAEDGAAVRGTYARSDWPLRQRLLLTSGGALRRGRVLLQLLTAEARGVIPRLGLTTLLLEQEFGTLAVQLDPASAETRVRMVVARRQAAARAAIRSAAAACEQLSAIEQLFGANVGGARPTRT